MRSIEIVDCGGTSLVDFRGAGFDIDIRRIGKEFLRLSCRLNDYKKFISPFAIQARLVI